MCCQEEIIDISRILRCYVICPHLTLADNRADCCVVILRGIFILFQKMFQVDQFIIPIKILDVLRLGQSIVKCQLFLRQPQFLTIIVQLRDLLCRFQKFLDTTKNADGKPARTQSKPGSRAGRNNVTVKGRFAVRMSGLYPMF